MTHELFIVPLSLAEVNGELRSGSRAVFSEILTSDILCCNHLEATDMKEETLQVIDWQASVISVGKPQTGETSGALADIFLETAFRSRTHY